MSRAGAGPHRRPRRPAVPRRTRSRSSTGSPRTAPTLIARGRRTSATLASEQTGLDDLGRRRLPRAARAAPRCDEHRGRPRAARVTLTVRDGSSAQLLKNRLLLEDLHRTAPRDRARRDRAPDHHLRAAAHRHDAPAQPALGRPEPAPPAVLGEPRAGAARERASGAGRARPAARAHRGGARPRQRADAALQAHARDDRRARARGDPAARDRPVRRCSSRRPRRCRLAGLLPARRPDRRTTRT